MKRKLVALQVPGRVTRSALQKATENADNVIQVRSYEEEVQERVSKKTRSSICSTGLEKAENLTESHVLHKDNFVQSAKSHNSKMNMTEKHTMARKKETVSKQTASVGQNPATERVKAKRSSSTKKAQQTEGFSYILRFSVIYFFCLCLLDPLGMVLANQLCCCCSYTVRMVHYFKG